MFGEKTRANCVNQVWKLFSGRSEFFGEDFLLFQKRKKRKKWSAPQKEKEKVEWKLCMAGKAEPSYIHNRKAI